MLKDNKNISQGEKDISQKKEFSIEELMELSSRTEEFLFDNENLCNICSHTCSGVGTLTD